MYSKMNIVILSLIMTMLVLGGCSSGGSSDSSTTSTTTSLSGVAQKGAFFKDSTVSLCKLDDKLVCTDKKLEIKVSDDKGSYEFKTLPWSGLSRLTITGYYLDELTGEKSLSPATITAIIDIKSKVKQKSNTNLLTDLRAKRMKKLVDAGKSKEDAVKESKEDVKKLFHVSSDDFSALNLTDFTQGKASVNVELLRLSAAVANAQDPVATLEELMKIYNEYGIEGVLNSTLYKTLMGLIKDVDVKAVVTKIVGTDEANALTIVNVAPIAIANIVTYGSVDNDAKVRISLLGTEFIDAPSISVSSTNNLLGIDAMHLADDNKSVVLDMNLSTSCQDINATFTVDYLGLKDVENPIRTTVLRYKNANEYCVTENTDDANLGTITMSPQANISLVPMENNQIILSLAGTEFENYTGTIDAELITSSDTLAIVNTVVADDNKSVVFTLNENTDYCADNNVTIGLYTNNLKDVPNESDTFKSNKIRYVSPNVVASCGGNTNQIPISFNRAPTVSITPSALSEVPAGSTVELNATAEDINTEDSVTLLWKYKKVGSDTYITAGTTDKFSQTFTSAGNYIVEVTATDNHNASTTASVEFEVVAVNHAPTVSISPSGDRDIYVGDSVILKSHAADEDGDDLTISWKIKESAASEFTRLDNYGETGFNHTFDTIGTYLVVVEAEDGNGLKADANITVRVIQAPAVTLTLPDINTSITVKGHDAFPDQGQSGVAATLETAPEHGSVEFYLVGNESPYIQYTSTDCFVGKDSFIYKSGDDYGRVNVTITSPSTLNPLSETKTLFNTETINGEYLRAKSADESVAITTSTHDGNSSLSVVGNEIINYNYDPSNSFTGNDFFEYSVNESINACPYSAVGRINFIVKSFAPVVTTPTKPGFRTLLSSNNPKDHDNFGSGVAIEGNTIVVGVPGHQIDGYKSRGEVVVYQKTDKGADVIEHIQNPDLQNDSINRHFGQTVALKDGFLAVVAPGIRSVGDRATIYSNITKVYVYKQEDNNSFTYLQTFNAESSDTGSYFAYDDIDINKNYLVIGAHGETVDSVENGGAAYVYKKEGDYFATHPVLLSDENSTKYGPYATKVALMDDLVLVSMPYKQVYKSEGDTNNYGAVYVYKDSGSGLEQVSVLNSPQFAFAPYSSSARFGASLAVNGNMLAVGIPDATVNGLSEVGYVDTYMRSGNGFTLLSRISDSDPVKGEKFGTTVAIENPYLVISNTATSNSDDTSKAEKVQLYQYSGADSNYTKLDEFEHIPTYNRWLTFKERASFGAGLDISDGTIISSAKNAFNFSKLQTRSYKAGQAYLLEADMQRPYWVDYKSSIVRSDDITSYSANISKPDTLEFVSSGVGVDSSLFTYNLGYIDYGVTGNAEACMATCGENNGGDACYAACEEESGTSAVLDFYNPTDANSDNKYNVDMKLTYNGEESIYPFTWEVKDSMNFTEGHNDGMYFSQYDYNRLQLTGVGTTDYASELMFQDEKAYVRSKDAIYVYNKNLDVPELLSYDSKISIGDVVSTNEINMSDATAFLSTYPRASFDVDGSHIATMSTHRNIITTDTKTIDETDSYIHLFNNGSYEESIVVHRDSQNKYPCTDNEECRKDHKVLRGVQLEKGMVFASYQNYNYYHDDNLTGYQEWEHEEINYGSGVMIYDYNGTDYNLLQTISVPTNNAHMSEVNSFRADGDFLLINGSNESDDYSNPNDFIRVYKFNGTQYVLLQTFTLPADVGRNRKASLENGFVLIESQKIDHTNLDTDIYKYDANSKTFVLLDTITNEEAGATYTDGFTGVHIQVANDGSVYLYKRFYKRLEIGDGISSFLGNAAYIGVFKLDTTTNKFRFVDSFTHRDGNNYFALSFAVDGDVVIANTRNSNYLHSFKLTR